MTQASRIADTQARLPQHVKGNCPYCGKCLSQSAAELSRLRDDNEWLREQGQREGFAAAVQQLRDMSAQKPMTALAAPAAVLADSLEQSRIPRAALTGDSQNG